jgi:hypothetical protein
MRKFIGTLAFSCMLAAPVALRADDHPMRYEDRAHHDRHEWNEGENTAYRHYVDERKMKYRDFNRLNRRDQDHYWTWRHEHMDNDRH